MSLEAGSKVGPYEIVEPLGAGGMGEVYRARDTRLQREVAIKVLPQRHVDDADARARFEREAQAVAALSHPNIVSIYDFGFIDGAPFAVSELLQGETLRKRLSSGKLAWRRSVEIGIELAEGLAAAHSKGIVHRDLKPENIFLTEDGRIKILDFGLAQLESLNQFGEHSSAPTMVTKTEPGTVLGTVGYMSPEQVRGQPTDERSDIFSLGAILFEMVTGQRAFTGETSSDIMAAILRDEVSGTEDSGVSVPMQLEKVIVGCLRKDPGKRLQTAREVKAELKAALGSGESAAMTRPRPAPSRDFSWRWLPKAAGVALAAALFAGALAGLWLFFTLDEPPADPEEIRSLAVMPFQIDGAEEQVAYLSEEVAEGLINRLSEAEDLRVMAWSVVRRYRGDGVDPMAVGEELGVDAVLTGRVSQREETVTVQASLIDSRRGFQIWGERFEQPFSQATAFQEEVARRIAERLELDLPPSGLAGAEGGRLDPEAYRHYLEARHAQSDKQMTEKRQEEVEEQLESLQKALNIDSNFTLARKEMAEALALAGAAGHIDSEIAMPMAKDFAMQVIGLDKTAPDARAVVASVHARYEYEWEKAEEQFEEALKLNPRSIEVLQRYAMDCLVPQGRFDEAERHLKTARQQAPGSKPILLDLGRLYYYQRRYPQAIGTLEKVAPDASQGLLAEQYIALCKIQQGRPEEAAARLESKVQPESGQAFIPARRNALAVLGLAFGRSGRRDKAERVMRALRGSRRPARWDVLLERWSGRELEPGRPSARPGAMAEPGHSPPPLPPPPPPAAAGSRSQVAVGPEARVDFLARDSLLPYWAALVYIGLGENEQALKLLERTVQVRAAEAIYLDVDPVMDPLRDLEAFENLIDILDL